MNDDQEFPALKTFRQIEALLFSENMNISGSLKGFLKSINQALDNIGFTDEYVRQQTQYFAKDKAKDFEIEDRGATVSKVIKDIIWGMIELDDTTVSLLDTPILQRLRYIKQNGFTYLVYPPASHARFEHSLGVFAVASKYIESINASASRTERFAKDLTPQRISPKLALDIKHAALMHDIGHFPFSHVLEAIYESAPLEFKFGSSTVRDFEICFMDKLRDSKSHLSERLSVALILSPRFKKFYTALRRDKDAYLRIACLISGTPLDSNTPGYSQLISGAVDCDKVDYLLRDSFMCNVPVAIDKARLFLNSALVECSRKTTLKKLADRGVINLARADLDKSALILVLNSSGVDTIEEVAFARATLYERVYRHSVTRNAERILAVAISEAAKKEKKWINVFESFELGDDTLLESLQKAKASTPLKLSAKLRRRSMPKRAFAFSPDFYTPIVPYISIFSGISDGEIETQYYHEVISKDPFHAIVEDLKERSPIFLSNKNHTEIEHKITLKATRIRSLLRANEQQRIPTGNAPDIFFIPLPDHSSTPTSCAIVTREGELESSGDYSRAPQLISAKEIGRSVGFVTCDQKWAEIVFLAAQEVLYDYFGNDVIRLDLPIQFDYSDAPDDGPLRERTINVGAIKRFYVPEDLATRRCRLNKNRLASYRRALSEAGYYGSRPRLSTPVIRTAEISKLVSRYKDFSGQHGWNVTEESLLAFIGQFPHNLRDDAKELIRNLNFLNRHKTGDLLRNSTKEIFDELANSEQTKIHIVPLAGTSGHVAMELLKQEFRKELKHSHINLSHSIHETLGVASRGDNVIFIDDNIGSGTQFSAQLRSWTGTLTSARNQKVRIEKGIELSALDKNRRELFEQLNIWLATCVGTNESERRVMDNLEKSKIMFRGIRFGAALSYKDSKSEKSQTEWSPSNQLIEFLRQVGAECIRHARGLSKIAKSCMADSLGYGNYEGQTVTLWNVPTSTYTALWCPGMVEGEPWFPLFIRRGYVEDLIIA
jgi:HD superfamily phosphohydrolase